MKVAFLFCAAFFKVFWQCRAFSCYKGSVDCAIWKAQKVVTSLFFRFFCITIANTVLTSDVSDFDTWTLNVCLHGSRVFLKRVKVFTFFLFINFKKASTFATDFLFSTGNYYFLCVCYILVTFVASLRGVLPKHAHPPQDRSSSFITDTCRYHLCNRLEFVKMQHDRNKLCLCSSVQLAGKLD